jgi:hypothetical protein
MKVGMLIAMQNHPDDYHKDHELYWEECRLADLAESLGFDSLWAVEHHFDAYAMIPDVVQFLTYIAGRTSRIQLGTAVIVLPWHDARHPFPRAATGGVRTRCGEARVPGFPRADGGSSRTLYRGGRNRGQGAQE